jgi:hypothetical protein
MTDDNPTDTQVGDHAGNHQEAKKDKKKHAISFKA